MTTRALIIGSVGTLVEMSELDRLAHNEAFERFGLSWRWDRDTYASLLPLPSELARIDEHGIRVGEPLAAHQLYSLHDLVLEIRSDAIRRAGSDRPGVIELLDSARHAGLALAWVTTADADTVAAVAVTAGVDLTHFDVVFDGSSSERPSTYALYQQALDRLGVAPEQAIALEDSPRTREAAENSNIPTVVFPGALYRDASQSSGKPTVTGDRAPTIEGLASLLGTRSARLADASSH